MLDYYSALSDDALDGSSSSPPDFLFDDNSATLYDNGHNDSSCEDLDFNFSTFDDIFVEVQKSDTAMMIDTQQNSELDSKDSLLLQQELDTRDSDSAVQLEMTNNFNGNRGFPEFPVSPLTTSAENFKLMTNVAKYIVEKDHCYCKPAENASKKTFLDCPGRDELYWQRRMRNNEAAKRSREAKRARDIAAWQKARSLEKNNAQLRREINKLMANIAENERKLRSYKCS